MQIFEDIISAIFREFKPFYLLIITFTSAMFELTILPYRIGAIVDDAQSRLSLLADILGLPLPAIYIAILAGMWMFYCKLK